MDGAILMKTPEEYASLADEALIRAKEESDEHSKDVPTANRLDAKYTHKAQALTALGMLALELRRDRNARVKAAD